MEELGDEGVNSKKKKKEWSYQGNERKKELKMEGGRYFIGGIVDQEIGIASGRHPGK
jgi:hypothetical protein